MTMRNDLNIIVILNLRKEFLMYREVHLGHNINIKLHSLKDCRACQ